MTLTPRDLAFAWMAAPEPESRFTSSSTFAPLVISCSACCCWVDLSPWAFWISTGTPACLNACCRSGRSNDSQRTDDFVSGSRTPTFCALSPPPLLLLLLLLSSEPHAATPSARPQRAPPIASARTTNEDITLLLRWDGTWWVRVRSASPWTHGPRGPVRRASRHDRREFRRRSRRCRLQRRWRSGGPPPASAPRTDSPPRRTRR